MCRVNTGPQGTATVSLGSPISWAPLDRPVRAHPTDVPGTDEFKRSTSLGVWPLELQCERRVDLKVAQQEGPFVESLAPQPAGDFGVALTGVAGPADGHDVAERVPPAARERQHAVSLQRSIGGTAVGAPTPGRLERGPLPVAEVVLDAIHAALAPASGPRPTTPAHHRALHGRQDPPDHRP